MFERLKRLLTGAANKGMDQLETPEVLAEKIEQELQTNLKQLQEGFTSSLANEKLLEKQVKANAEQLETWQRRAAVAVQNNNDEVAKQCLVKKNEATAQDQQLKTQLAQQQATSTDLKQKYAEMQEQMRQFQLKKTSLLSRAKSGDAVANVNELLANTGTGTSKWEEKIRQKEALGQANQELAGQNKLSDQFQQTSIEDELAALKSQQSATTPKLIIDTSNSEN